jgi:hypothetical protein
LHLVNLCPFDRTRESTADSEANLLVFAVAVDLGIYNCTDPLLIQTPGATCYEMMAFGAPAEWFMSILWISFMFNLAYEFYTTPQVWGTVRAAYHA